MDEKTRIFEQNRQRLEGLAYRMLGTAADAQDVVQETYLRWCHASLDEIRHAPSWLVTACSRLAMDALRSARVRRETYVGVWLPEPLLDDHAAAPDALQQLDETVSVALLLALEKLSPAERAAFLLHEVFACDFDEIAAALDRTPVACRKLASRARARVQQEAPRFEASADEHMRLVEAFLQATRTGEVERIKSLLAEAVELHADGGGKAEASPEVLRGAASVAHLFAQIGAKQRGVSIEVMQRRFNGAPGFLIHEDGRLTTALSVMTREGLLCRLYSLRNPDKLAAFRRSSAPLKAPITSITMRRTKLQEAYDPSTPPTRLHELIATPRGAIRAAVAANPNASPSTLLLVCCDHPSQVLQNPAFDLAALADPRLLDGATQQALQALATLPSLPPHLVALLLGLTDTRRRAILASAARAPSLIEAFARDPSYVVRGTIAASPRCPEALLDRLSNDESHKVRESVASAARCPRLALQRLSHDEHPAVQSALARRPGCPAPILERLSQARDGSVRALVAANPATPAHVAHLLAADVDFTVRWRVAERPRCPVALLERLASDESARVRAAVAAHRSCPPLLLERFALDPQWLVRSAVAAADGCPLELRERLLTDEHPEVRQNASEAQASPRSGKVRRPAR